ncbi:DUF262 domain-containing protein [Chryseobacterium sp. WG23]|uniref:DUF262 domain-containing protein n=1 Tax=Chryseobacterium sp. WG23 TaxID=2926910 RepID=UPI00211E837F|nr:DUF262 domain-containing protein [Chryseobacterium sp. WG23]MCQ9634750.1 DUF262 domain-containing protein [Chryseobacterium sp. WG23]
MSENSNSAQTDLTIRNESIQRIYNFYKNNILYVNRRYQRKLIWTFEEKQRFIDSLIKGLPVPLILLAETTIHGSTAFEIIDGMQRLNTINAFIEGEFTHEGCYFDLNTLVESKSLLDSGELIQKEPILDRLLCERFASYILPVSVYSFTDEDKIDEIFVRINSYGRHLSRQELRAAGTLDSFGDLVRIVSTDIRTDVSHDDILNLKRMKEISITNVGLDYGINVDDLFWVANNVITKEMVRESRDEEIVADILSAMAFMTIPATSSGVLDEYYGLKKGDKTEELSLALNRIGADVLRNQFLTIYNIIRKVIEISGKNLRDLLFNEHAQRIPRYFQTVFLALHKLVFKENKEVNSYTELIAKLQGIASHITITEGGNWSSSNRVSNVDAVSGIISSAFKEGTDDPGAFKWLTEFESLLMQSKTEQTSYDFKQGFTKLDGTNQFNEDNFSKIILTLTAIANNSARNTGYVCVGVCDSKADSDRVKTIYGVETTKYRDFYVSGIEHEFISIAKDRDDFFRQIIQKIKSQPISEDVKDYLCKNLRLINYFNKDVMIFKIASLNTPMFYNGKYYVRHGANVQEVQPEKYADFFLSYK